jgi:hypothetical protein
MDASYIPIAEARGFTTHWIITNPPYKYAKEFVEKALELIDDSRKVAMFLKLTFLEGKARKKLFASAPPEKNICIQ